MPPTPLHTVTQAEGREPPSTQGRRKEGASSVHSRIATSIHSRRATWAKQEASERVSSRVEHRVGNGCHSMNMTINVTQSDG